MAFCKPRFGIALRHLQPLLLALPYASDYLLYDVIETATSNREVTRETAAALSTYKFIASSTGRILSLAVILKVNNKLLLLITTMLELLVMVTWFLFLRKYDIYIQAILVMTLTFVQGTRYGIALNILTKWCTPGEFTLVMTLMEAFKEILRSLLLIFVFGLQSLGLQRTESYVYLTILVKSGFWISWLIFGAEEPLKSFFISSEELNHLKRSTPSRLKTDFKAKIPWKGIFTTPIFYGCAIAEVGANWVRSTENDKLNLTLLYLKSGSVYYIVGLYSAMVAACVVAGVTDCLIRRNSFPVGNIRKTMTSLTAWGCGCSLLLLGDAWPKGTVWLGFHYVFKTANLADTVTVLHTAAPNYVAVTYIIVSSVPKLLIVVKPPVEGYLKSHGEIPMVLYISGLILYMTHMGVLLCGSNNLREFNSYGTVPWKEPSVTSLANT